MSLTLTNTDYFREAAIFFEKNGFYTDAPVGTKDYNDFWDEQEKRCLEGYRVGDLWIPGRFYWYLNFCPILRNATEEELKRKPHIKRVFSLPKFFELDYYWWTVKHVAQFGGDESFIKSLKNPYLYNRNYNPGHLSVLKTRRAGFSYKEAADSTYNYNFIPSSKSLFFAAHNDYLQGEDGVLTKAWDVLNWLNEHTDWYKNRQLSNTKWVKKASYIEDNIERGFKSSISGQIIDSPDKSRGRSGIKISFEEGGSFPNLLDAWEICMPQVKEGGIINGVMTAFGTGGNENDAGLEGLEELFTKPEAYECLCLKDHSFLDEVEATEVGFFVPYIYTLEKTMDSNGNVDKDKAIDLALVEREVRKKAKNKRALLKMMAEKPLNFREALMRFGKSYFPIQELKEQLKRVEEDEVQGFIKHGDLFISKEGRVEFKLNEEAQPVEEWPYKNLDNIKGCITMLESPYKSTDGDTPSNMYQIVVDPFYKDDFKSDDFSLGATYVYKRKNTVSTTEDDILVAWYVGRPERRVEYNRNVFLLARYYNAKVQSEIQGGGQGLLDYARENNLIHYCDYQPLILANSKEVLKESQRSYFITVNADLKNQCMQDLSDWLLTERGLEVDDEKTSYTLNLHRIYDKGLLKELIKFTEDGNFDRISAMLVLMAVKRDLEEREIEEEGSNDGDDFYFRNFFSNKKSNRESLMSVNQMLGLE